MAATGMATPVDMATRWVTSMGTTVADRWGTTPDCGRRDTTARKLNHSGTREGREHVSRPSFFSCRAPCGREIAQAVTTRNVVCILHFRQGVRPVAYVL